MRWLITWLPKTSFNRTLLLTAIVMLAGQVISFIFISRYFFATYFLKGEQDTSLMFVWLLCLPVLALMATYLTVKQIDRPLARLRVGAEYIGRGQWVEIPDDWKDTEEFKAVVNAFNQMSRRLNTVNQERTLMLAGVSHDLRTPLTRLRLSLELLHGLEPELCDGMVRDIEEMDTILEQFISFVRDGSDELFELEDMNNLVTEVVGQHEGHHVIQVQLNPLEKIKLKRVAMKRLLANLIQNAIKHGGDQPIEVLTRMRSSWIEVCVLDRGKGIDESQQEQLFKPFVRGDVARSQHGSGLGLAIVKQIAELHRGKVSLANRPGGGAQATVLLPL